MRLRGVKTAIQGVKTNKKKRSALTKQGVKIEVKATQNRANSHKGVKGIWVNTEMKQGLRGWNGDGFRPFISIPSP